MKKYYLMTHVCIINMYIQHKTGTVMFPLLDYIKLLFLYYFPSDVAATHANDFLFLLIFLFG